MGDPVQVPAKLLEIRKRTDLKLKRPKYLKETFIDFAGRERPLALRYYQVQGVLHLVAMRRFLLGDDTGLGKCCPYDTLLPTDQGLLRLGELAPPGADQPDSFYPLSEPRQVWTGWNWAPVKQFYCGGTKPTRTVRTRRGYETEGTLVHPLWLRGPAGEAFTPLAEIKVGDVLCLSRTPDLFPTEEPNLPQPTEMAANTRLYPLPDKLTPELATLLGYIVGEGYTAQRQAVHVTQYREHNPEVHDQIRGLFKELFDWEGNQTAKNRDEEVNVSSTHIRAYLEGLGVRYGLAATKCVPWPIFRGTQASVSAFLRAVWDGEGSVTAGVVELSNASEQLLKELQILLLRFGILSSRSSKKVKGREETYWRLTLCGDDARKFSREIGFLTPRKRVALEELTQKKSNNNLDVVPYAPIESLRAAILKGCSRSGANACRRGSGLKQFGISFEKNLSNIRNGGRQPTYSFLEKMLEVARQAGVPETHPAYLEMADICQSHWFYDPIESITEGEAPVADIEVDDPRHCFVGNGFVNHNTIQAIAALCCIWERDPDRKAIILTTKSAAKQWANEFAKFTKGIRVILCKGSPAQRAQARSAFEKSTGPTVLISGYRSMVQDFTHIQRWEDYIFITDEATTYKNPQTQVHQVCRHMSEQADRVWALTATLIKNNLMEGFGVYQVVNSHIFDVDGRPMSKNQFMLYYCLTRQQPIHGGRFVTVIVGYHPDKIREFKEVINPWFIGRPKHEVATELPTLTTKLMEVELSDEQEEKYAQALGQLLEMGRGDTAQVKEVTKLTAIAYCQEIVNDLELIDCEGESPKLDALIEMVSEGGELEGEKVIVFSRFEKMVSIIMRRLAKEKIKAVRVTGKEKEDQRDDAMTAFQSGDAQVICITTAGSESINLQAAKALVCYDTPWSAGDYLQLLGRMIRIGSTHDKCYVIHLLGQLKKKSKPAIDFRVMEVLGKKMHLIESVLGKRIKGDQDASAIIPIENEISDLYAALRQDAKEAVDA
jgi:intein/homing endonuclease